MLSSLLLYALSSDKSHIIVTGESICKPQPTEATREWFQVRTALMSQQGLAVF